MVVLVKGGPRVPAAIMRVHTTAHPETGEPMDRSPFLAAFIAGEPVALDDVWLKRGTEITAAEYHYQTATAIWAKAHAPHEPAARPREAVDPLTVQLPF